MRAKKNIETRLLCPVCRTYTTIRRNAARRKKEGHYKKLYCYVCKDTHNFIELNDNYTDEEIEDLIEKWKEGERNDKRWNKRNDIF